MNIFNLSWSINIEFPGSGGNLNNPSWENVDEKLHIILKSIGTVTLEAEDENERSRSLQVRVENFMYFITLGVETENDWTVRTRNNIDGEGKTISILGDFLSERAIFRDEKTVLDIFKDFFHTGNVSKEYLS